MDCWSAKDPSSETRSDSNRLGLKALKGAGLCFAKTDGAVIPDTSL